MNPVEIEEAVSNLALEPFDRAEFPFQFLRAFDNPETTIKRLRSGSTNQSDIPGGVLQRNNIHIATCATGGVDATLKALRQSPKTTSAKAKFILATDGEAFQAEDLNGGGTVACSYAEFPDHFGFFLPLAGITTVREIRESSFDVKATGRLNRLYVQLLKENPDWAKADRQHDMNHFMARLIFCFFAEDTDIFLEEGLFTKTVEQMSAGDTASTHRVIGEIFRAMDTKPEDREAASLPRYATKFPYVNGQLFSGSTDAPVFSKVARSYLLHIGELPWEMINPDIFGSMIQAVTDDEERGSLGMHYTSVPNILKVLNPLFLDDLRQQLEEAGTNSRKLLNLRNRIARIRVFDPACGSGNFLVIAYKEMRGIEAEINKRRGEADRKSDIPLTNFRGIELRDFPAEIARLALIIAEYQCDVLCRGQKEAVADFLPLGSENWITCGNALRLDWLSICPPTGTGVKVTSNDLAQTALDQAEVDFQNEGGETYVCGNPPFAGQIKKTDQQRADMDFCLSHRVKSYKNLDFVACWYILAAEYLASSSGAFAFVSTNSIAQGRQVELLWPAVLKDGLDIFFAHTAFKWSNNASRNAGVTCVIVGVRREPSNCFIYTDSIRQEAAKISGYLSSTYVDPISPLRAPISDLPEMTFGSMPNDGGHLLMSRAEWQEAREGWGVDTRMLRIFIGADELIKGQRRYCVWLPVIDPQASEHPEPLAARIRAVREAREASSRAATKQLAATPSRFGEVRHLDGVRQIVMPAVSSEGRDYLPADLVREDVIVSNRCFVVFNDDLISLSLLVSTLHRVWIDAVCGKLEQRYNYSNTLGWNTFPVVRLTTQDKLNLRRCAEDILLAREAHFPATIADLYDPQTMPEDLRRAHEANDEVLERIYIGRRFRNDTERLEKLFELYTKMTTKPGGPKKAAA